MIILFNYSTRNPFYENVSCGVGVIAGGDLSIGFERGMGGASVVHGVSPSSSTNARRRDSFVVHAQLMCGLQTTWCETLVLEILRVIHTEPDDETSVYCYVPDHDDGVTIQSSTPRISDYSIVSAVHSSTTVQYMMHV